jgi:hypothetical protein
VLLNRRFSANQSALAALGENEMRLFKTLPGSFLICLEACLFRLSSCVRGEDSGEGLHRLDVDCPT